MNASYAPASPLSMIFKVVLLVAGAYAIYYSYKVLFASPTKTVNLISSIHRANVDKPYIFTTQQIPRIYEGGEYSMAAWVYVQNWTGARNNFYKEVLTLGNRATDSGKITCGVYLDSMENTVHVKTNSVVDCSGVAVGGSEAPVSSGVCLSNGVYNAMFKNPNIGTPSIAMGNNDCSVTPFELQKWVHVVVVLNGKTTDVYLDGKLARSCVNSGVFAVDSDYTIQVAANGGFGGFVSGVQVCDFALNPEQVYRMYMAGPMAAITMSEYISSLFDPQSIGTLDYPKMN
jgi:hypothetical protein